MDNACRYSFWLPSDYYDSAQCALVKDSITLLLTMVSMGLALALVLVAERLW
jgi:hypothetical protein